MRYLKTGPPMWMSTVVLFGLVAGLIYLAAIGGQVMLLSLLALALVMAIPTHFFQKAQWELHRSDPFDDWKAYRRVSWSYIFMIMIAFAMVGVLGVLGAKYIRPGMEVFAQSYLGLRGLLFAFFMVSFLVYAIKQIRKMPLGWQTPSWGDFRDSGGMTPEERREQIRLVWNRDDAPPDRMMLETS